MTQTVKSLQNLIKTELKNDDKPVKKRLSNAGRKSVMTEFVLQQLQQAFSLGATDEEACAYADISPRALYYYQERNPEFLQKKEKWKQLLILRARQTVVNDLDDPKSARWYLGNKGKDFQKDPTSVNVNIGIQLNQAIDDDRKNFK